MAKDKVTLKGRWLQRFEGVEVLAPHSNDGVFIFVHDNTDSKGKPYTRLTICPFYKDENGKRIWKFRRIRSEDKKTGKKILLYQYDIVSIDLAKAGDVVDAIQEVSRGIKPATSRSDALIQDMLRR